LIGRFPNEIAVRGKRHHGSYCAGQPRWTRRYGNQITTHFSLVRDAPTRRRVSGFSVLGYEAGPPGGLKSEGMIWGWEYNYDGKLHRALSEDPPKVKQGLFRIRYPIWRFPGFPKSFAAKIRLIHLAPFGLLNGIFKLTKNVPMVKSN